jgi:hypothetical protein
LHRRRDNTSLLLLLMLLLMLLVATDGHRCGQCTQGYYCGAGSTAATQTICSVCALVQGCVGW